MLTATLLNGAWIGTLNMTATKQILWGLIQEILVSFGEVHGASLLVIAVALPAKELVRTALTAATDFALQ